MEAMGKDEVTDYYELAQTGIGEGDSWSRKLIGGEKTWLEELPKPEFLDYTEKSFEYVRVKE